jgi:hypothetical protein
MEYIKVKSKKDLEIKVRKIMENENITSDEIIQKLKHSFSIMKFNKECIINVKNIPSFRNRKCINYENNFNFKTKVVANKSFSIKISSKGSLEEYNIEYPLLEYKYRIISVNEDSIYNFIKNSLEKDINNLHSFKNIHQLLLKYNIQPLTSKVYEKQLTSYNIALYKNEHMIKNNLDNCNLIYDILDKVQYRLNCNIKENFKINKYRIVIFRNDIGYNKINQIIKMNIKLFKNVDAKIFLN